MSLKKGEIYELKNGDNYYVGCTENTSEERFKQHLKSKKDPIHQIKGEWTCRKLIDVYYNDRDELLETERKYIGMYANQKKKLLNTQKVPTGEIKYEIKGPHIDERMKIKFSVEERNGFILLKKKIDGKITTKKVSYGNKITKDQAMQQIIKIKDEMIKELDPELTIVL